jgi:RNA polymerase sigma-70 factor, ECF subfamily
MPSRPSFQDVFQAHSQYVWVTLRRLGARPAELEDLTHDVFIQVLRHLDEYDPERPMRPWLFAFAFRVAAEDRRRVRRRPEVAADLGQAPDFKPGPVEELLQQERRELARAAIDEVELNRRAVFILHELDGFAIPEVAKSLAIPLATAYSRLRLAREDFALITRRLRTRQR